MLTKEEMPACPVATTVALIGSKWKLLILRNLLARPWRFNEMKKRFGGHQSKGIDGQPPLVGGGWDHYPYCLPRGAAQGGICAQRLGRVHAAHYQRYGTVGAGVSKENKGG